MEEPDQSPDVIASPQAPDETRGPEGDLLRSLGIDNAADVTLLQFSSSFCQPCRATRVLLADVATTVPGVSHLEVDVEGHMDLVRQLDIRRTPTVLVLDRDGQVRKRASGVPRRSDVLAAVASASATLPAGDDPADTAR